MFIKKIFGLDISDYSIEALMLSRPQNFFGRPKVAAYARMVLRGEVVKNGIIKNPAKLADNISKLLKSAQPQPITTPYCVISLPESQVFTAVFKLPAGLKHDEVRNTIPYKAEEVIPFQTSEVYFDFKTISRQGSTQEVFYVAVPTKIVDTYVEVLKSIGLKPIALDLESISQARALVDFRKKMTKGMLMMDIGSRTTNLNIFDQNGIRQSLTIKMAGNHFTKVLVKNLALPEKEANALKMKAGFDTAGSSSQAATILDNEAKKIIVETKKFIDYYQAETKRTIGEVVLVGGSSLLPKFDQYVANNLKLETNLGKPLEKLENPQELVKFKNKAVLFANVVGLALRGFYRNPSDGDINLLPVKFKVFALKPAKGDKRAWQSVYIRLGVFGFLILVLILLFALRQRGNDFYQRVFPSPQYESNIEFDVDPQVLDEIRSALLNPPLMSTTTNTDGLKLKVKPITLGFVNVRQEPNPASPKIGQAASGLEYIILEEQKDWFKIQVNETTTGWVSATYVDKLE
ncbi:MAG: type IV pilus assembly protein PilM [Candidatus Buchananbacteria bacterium]